MFSFLYMKNALIRDYEEKETTVDLKKKKKANAKVLQIHS